MPAETHVERSPIGPDDGFRMIRGRLAEILEIEEDRITLDSDFAADLDADSLALIELVEALEEELGERTVGFTLDHEDLAALQTVPRAASSTGWVRGPRARCRPGGAVPSTRHSTRGCSSRSVGPSPTSTSSTA